MWSPGGDTEESLSHPDLSCPALWAQQLCPCGGLEEEEQLCGRSLHSAFWVFAVLERRSGSLAGWVGEVGFGLKMETIHSWKLTGLAEATVLSHYQPLVLG